MMATRPIKIYLIGSLRNSQIPYIAQRLREAGFEVFDDWFAPGPETDECWREYETARGRSYQEALAGHHATNVFAFDRFHLTGCHGVVLALPAGKSGHLELGYMAGQGKPSWILRDETNTDSRFDVMAQFATGVCASVDALVETVQAHPWPKYSYIVDLHLADAMWLIGLLEGEGSFVVDKPAANRRARPYPRIALQMTDYDIMQRAAQLLDTPMHGPYIKPAPRKPAWAIMVGGLKAAEYMRVLLPYFGARRQEQIRAAISGWQPHAYRQWRRKK